MSTIKVDTLQTRAGSTAAVTGAGFVATDQIRGNTAAGSTTVVAEGGSTTTNLQQGLCKCWTQIDGTGTIESRDSFNVTGLTDNGTGDYTITIANDMGNDDYAVLQNALYPASRVLHVGDDGSGFAIAAGSYRQLMSYTTGNNGEATAADADYVMTTFHGDLA